MKTLGQIPNNQKVAYEDFELSTLTVTPSANQDDYAPSGIGTTCVLKVDCSASIKITGIVGGAEGRLLTIKNSSSDYLLWLENENTASTAANRFRLPKGFPAFLMPGDYITLIYDGTNSRWEVWHWANQGMGMGLAIMDDFITGTATLFTSTVSGTGASAQSSAYLIDTTERPLGVTQIDTGTTATGRATLGEAAGGSGSVKLGLGPALSVARVAVEATVSATETFQVIVGFCDASGGTWTDGVAWENRWDGAAAEWSQTRMLNGAATRSNTGSPSSDNNYIWLIVFVNPGATRADFIYSTNSVSFTKADSPTTGIPTSARSNACSISFIKSVGTTQRNVSVDLLGYRVDYVRG